MDVVFDEPFSTAPRFVYDCVEHVWRVYGAESLSVGYGEMHKVAQLLWRYNARHIPLVLSRIEELMEMCNYLDDMEMYVHASRTGIHVSTYVFNGYWPEYACITCAANRVADQIRML